MASRHVLRVPCPLEASVIDWGRYLCRDLNTMPRAAGRLGRRPMPPRYLDAAPSPYHVACQVHLNLPVEQRSTPAALHPSVGRLTGRDTHGLDRSANILTGAVPGRRTARLWSATSATRHFLPRSTLFPGTSARSTHPQAGNAKRGIYLNSPLPESRCMSTKGFGPKFANRDITTRVGVSETQAGHHVLRSHLSHVRYVELTLGLLQLNQRSGC